MNTKNSTLLLTLLFGTAIVVQPALARDEVHEVIEADSLLCRLDDYAAVSAEEARQCAHNSKQCFKRLQACQGDLSHLQGEYNKVESAFGLCTTNLATEQEEHDAAKAALEQAQTDLTTCNEQLQAAMSGNSTAYNELFAQKQQCDSNLAALQGQFEGCQADLGEANKAIAGKDAEIEKLIIELALNDAENSELDQIRTECSGKNLRKTFRRYFQQKDGRRSRALGRELRKCLKYMDTL